MQRRKPGSKIRRKINQYKHIQKDTDNTINIQGIKRAIMFSKQECGGKKNKYVEKYTAYKIDQI